MNSLRNFVRSDSVSDDMKVSHVESIARKEITIDEAITPEEVFDSPEIRLVSQFLRTSVRKIGFYVNETEFQDYNRKMQFLMKKFGVKSNTEVFLRLLSEVKIDE